MKPLLASIAVAASILTASAQIPVEPVPTPEPAPAPLPEFRATLDNTALGAILANFAFPEGVTLSPADVWYIEGQRQEDGTVTFILRIKPVE